MNFGKRLERLRQYMAGNNIAASIVMQPENQFYYSNFIVRNYSRPIILFISLDKIVLIVPTLEEKHALRDALADQIDVYHEHPERAAESSSHLVYLDRVLGTLPEGATVGIEFSVMNTGLSSHITKHGLKLFDIAGEIAQARMIKDDLEIALLYQAGELVNLALAESLKNARPGMSEVEIDSFGNYALFQEATRKYPNADISFRVMTPTGVERTVMPHGFSNTKRLEAGEIAIQSRHVALNGYMAELERTFFMGSPTAKQKEVFQVMLEAQKAGIAAVAPGVKAKEIDAAARSVIQKAHFGEFFIHRTGHGLGISVHEGPYLRYDSDLVIQPGMVVSIEPAIYIPGIGGFRHSDTVLVTQSGSALMTNYPRELEDLILS